MPEDSVASKPRFKRILLKLSGEAFQGKKEFGIDIDYLKELSGYLKQIHELNVEMGIVVGGGNFWRGRDATSLGMDQATADYIGMTGTIMNALALQASLESIHTQVRVLSAIQVQQLAEPYIRRRAIRHIEKGRIVIFAGGTGSPFFSTDTCAALRAAEINADVVLKATNVDHIYSEDPKINKHAIRYKVLDYTELLTKDLKVIDATAVSLCREKKLPLIVFSIKEPENLVKVLFDENLGTSVKENR
ncbi:MAG: UMP kinase [Caldisericia bacterium]|nr:UMP kinase [Caldisericia bacterium]